MNGLLYGLNSGFMHSETQSYISLKLGHNIPMSHRGLLFENVNQFVKVFI